MVRQLEAERHGQLAFDFRIDAAPARLITLTPRQRPPAAETGGPSDGDISLAESMFVAASALDADEPGTGGQRRGPLPPRTRRRPVSGGGAELAPDYFEAHYNRANVLHDAGRFDHAAESYDAALNLEPDHPDAHFYLAVTLAKLERSADARPHWETNQRLAPDGAWAALAKEFTENF